MLNACQLWRGRVNTDVENDVILSYFLASLCSWKKTKSNTQHNRFHTLIYLNSCIGLQTSVRFILHKATFILRSAMFLFNKFTDASQSIRCIIDIGLLYNIFRLLHHHHHHHQVASVWQLNEAWTPWQILNPHWLPSPPSFLLIQYVKPWCHSECTASWEGAYFVPLWGTSCWWSQPLRTTGCSTVSPAALPIKACGGTACLANATCRLTASVSGRGS